MSLNEKVILTRYLFIKDEVELSLLTCILSKSDDALYWSYELYYSGFVNELVTLFAKIFYDFYYTLNPKFESYLFLKIKKILQTKEDDAERIMCVAQIVNNLLIRPFNYDVFMIRNIVSIFEIDDYITDDTIKILETKNLLHIGKKILETSNAEITMSEVLVYFSEKCAKMNVEKIAKNYIKIKNVFNKIDSRVILLAKTINYFTILNKIKIGRDLFFEVEPENLVIYETLETRDSSIKPYHILQKVVLCSIDSHKLFHLFELERKSNTFENIRDKYWYNWGYYASFSPLWKSRIEKYGGIIDNSSKKIVFTDDKMEDAFYNNYQYDPDEQSLKIQECMNPKMGTPICWYDFYNNWKKSLKNKNYIYEIDEDYLLNLEKIRY